MKTPMLSSATPPSVPATGVDKVTGGGDKQISSFFAPARALQKNLRVVWLLAGMLAATAAQGAQIKWQGTSTSWILASNWEGGQPPGANDVAVFNQTTTSATVNTPAAVGGIWLADISDGSPRDYTFGNANSTVITGNQTIDGNENTAVYLSGTQNNSLTLNVKPSFGQSTQILVANAGTLTFLSGFAVDAGNTLTLKASDAGGQIVNNASFTGAGAIIVDSRGLVSSSASSTGFSGSLVLKSGTFKALAGGSPLGRGSLQLDGGTLWMCAAPNSSNLLVGNASVTKSSTIIFDTVNSYSMTWAPTLTLASGVTLTLQGGENAPAGITVKLADNLALEGNATLNIKRPQNNNTILFSLEGNFDSPHTLTLTGDGNAQQGATAWTKNVNLTMDSAFSGTFSVLRSGNTFTGTFNVNGGVLYGSQSFSANADLVINGGSMILNAASAAKSLNLLAGEIRNAGASAQNLTLATGGTMAANTGIATNLVVTTGSFVMNGGTVAGTISVGTGAQFIITTSSVTLKNSANYDITGSGSALFDLQDNGMITLNYVINPNGGVTVQKGTLKLQGSAGIGNMLTAKPLTLAGGTAWAVRDNANGVFSNATNVTVNADSGLILDRETSGDAATHALGTLNFANNPTLTVQAGPMVTGTASTSFTASTLTGNGTLNLINGAGGGRTAVTFAALTSANGSTLHVDGSGDLKQSGIWSGNMGLTLEATYSGTATLSVNNTYSGATTVGGGLLFASGGSDRYSSNSALVITGGTVRASSNANNINTPAFLMTGGELSNINALNIATGGTISGGVFDLKSINVGQNLLINPAGSNDLTLATLFTGAGGVTIDSTGSGTIYFGPTATGATNRNTLQGETWIKNGNVVVSNTNAFSASSVLHLSGGTLTLGDSFTATAPQLYSFILDGGVLTRTGANPASVTLAATGPGGAPNTAFDIRSGKADVPLTGAIGLTKTTTGTAILSQSNTYTGATDIQDGLLWISGSLAASSAVTVGADGALGGTTKIAGAVTVKDGGSIGTGNHDFGFGTLSLASSLTLEGDTLTLGLSLQKEGGDLAALDHSTLALSTALDLSGITLKLDLFDYLADGGAFDTKVEHSWLGILTTGNAGGITGFEGATFAVNAVGFYAGEYKVELGTDGKSLDLHYTPVAVPEPGTWAMIVGGVGVLGLLRRRR